MNIFVLDESPINAAKWQHDRHVVKMVLESTQMLSTAAHAGMFSVVSPEHLYKPTHVNHPCNVWLRESMHNMAWLTCHLDGLISEYHFRFQKRHACDTHRWLFLRVVCEHFNIARSHVKIDGVSRLNPELLAVAALHTPFVYCGNPYFSHVMGSVIDSYRAMYAVEKLTQDHVKWTHRFLPDFLLSIDARFPLAVRDRIARLQHLNESQHVCPIRAAQPTKTRTIHVPRVDTPSRGTPIRFGIKA